MSTLDFRIAQIESRTGLKFESKPGLLNDVYIAKSGDTTVEIAMFTTDHPLSRKGWRVIIVSGLKLEAVDGLQGPEVGDKIVDIMSTI